MIENRYLELLHAELDGLNSPQESARLTAYLAANPEAQRLYEELRDMANVLGEVKPVEPPSHLQYAIMNTISRRHTARLTKPKLHETFTNWLREFFEPKFALSFAGGLAVGVVLFALALQLTTKEGVNDSKLYGTIGAPQTKERPAESRSFDIQHELANGEMKWRREGEMLVTELTLTATEAFELAILFDARAMKCNGISASDGGVLPDAVLQEGRLQLAHMGARSYRISFQPSLDATPRVRVQFQRNGEALYDKEILFDAR